MSYPWWRFRVTFVDGHVEDFTATGADISDAMHELLGGFLSWESEKEDSLRVILRTHNDIRSVEYLHCDTFGMDDESDKILLAEGAK